MTTFGQTLAQLRTARGLSQGKLADRAKVDHSAVSRLERSERNPSREMVERLADALYASTVDRNALLTSAGFHDLSTIVHALDELRHEVALLRRELAVRDAA
jgi:transcriptional regulator with XRE-family HTH domain